jgi:hypothetical protein
VGNDVPLGERVEAFARLFARDPRGRGHLRLLDGADVFLQSLRPGLAERIGLGPMSCEAPFTTGLLLDRRLRPRLARSGTNPATTH